MKPHILHSFDDDLRQLHEQVVAMTRLTLQQAHAALTRTATGETAEVAGFDGREQAVNKYEESIDEAAVTLIARRGPVASDLRTVIAFSKMATDLERIGDEAGNLNELAAEWHGGGGLLVDFDDETGWAAELLQRALAIVETLNVGQAEEMVDSQAKLVEPFRTTINQLRTLDQRDGSHEAVQRALAVRSIERIGEHACNLCEHVVYLARGIDVRHHQ